MLRLLSTVLVAVPMLALAAHADLPSQPAHALPAPGGAHPAGAELPNNICASCHAQRQFTTSAQASRLDEGDVAATLAYVRPLPRS